MSSTDERIVRMKFDNAQFKQAATDTRQQLTDIDKATTASGKSGGLLNLSKQMETVRVKASAMQVAVVTAISNIANRAVNAGINMAKSLTLDPLRQGFAEYEALLTKQNTIMNATGKSAGDVKKVLNELNVYSDKTIYSFGNMTDAVQKFVNAGVSLPQSVESIKGIANAAAYAGASTEEANRAMYAFSQSMSLGFVGLQDWNQIENANMGTIQFKNTLIDSAVAAGTLTKKGNEFVTASGKTISATKGWRDGLQEQWATTEVLNSALSKYSDNSTELGRKAQKAATEVRTFSAFMDTLKESLGSGWSQIFTALIGGLGKSTKMWTGLSEVVNGAVSMFFDFATAAAKTWRSMGGLESILQGFENIAAPFVALFKAIGAAWNEAFPTTGSSTGRTLAKLSEGFERMTRPLAALASYIPKITPYLTAFFKLIGMGTAGLAVVAKHLGLFVQRFRELFDLKMPSIGGGLSSFFDSIFNASKKLYDSGMKIASSLLDGIIAGFRNGSMDTVANVVGTGLLGAIFLTIRKFIKNGTNINLGDGILGNIRDSFDALTGSLKAMQTQIQAKTLMLIAGAIALITASVVALTFIDTNKLTKALSALAVGFGQLLAAMAILVKISGKAGFIKVPMIAAAMVLLATSILILVAAIALMGQLEWETIGRGLAGISGALVAISVGMRMMPKTLPITAAGLVLVSIALTGISGAIALMGSLEWSAIGKGLVTIAGALIGISIGMSLMPKTLPITAAGLVLVGIALAGIGGALKIMGSMSWDEIGRGLATLGGALGLLAVGLNLMSGTLFGSAALLVASTAIRILVPALISMSDMSWGEIAKGLVVLSSAMVILGVAMYAMEAALPGAAALLVVAPALMILALTMQVLASLSWEDIGKGLVALAGGLTVIGLAGLLIGPVVPALLGLGAALLLLGAALALAGVGVLAFTTALSILVGMGAGAIAYLSKYIEAFIDLLPSLAAGFGSFIIEFAKSIADRAPELIKSFVKVLSSLLDAANKLLPKIGKFIGKAIDEGLKVIEKAVPKYVKAGANIIIAVLNGLTEKIPEIVEAAIDLIIAFAQGIADGYDRILTAGVQLIADFLHALADTIRNGSRAIGNGIDDVISAMKEVGVDLVKGLIDGVKSMTEEGLGAIGDLASGMIQKARDMFKIFSPSKVFESIGTFVAKGLTKGIQDNAAAAITAVASMVSGQIAVATEYVSKFIQQLDQQALAATAKATGLQAAAEAAMRAAEKTKKNEKDDRSAERLQKKADKATRKAERLEERAEKEKARQERADEYADATLLERAQMRSEDAQNQMDAAKQAEFSAASKLEEARALREQAKAKGVSKKDAKAMRARAAELEKQAKKDAKEANRQIELARQSATDALTLQEAAVKEAAEAFQKQFDAEAAADAEDERFNKLTDAEKAAERRRQADILQAKANSDLQRAKELAYTDLEAANELAQQAMDQAEQARAYLQEAARLELQQAQGTGASAAQTGGTVVNLDATEAASIAFRDYESLYDASYAAAAGGQHVEFNQYNTSPEALNPTDVYRNTNNQLAYAAQHLQPVA